MLLHKTKRRAGRMWRKSCASFPPGTYACLTYPQEVNLRKTMYFRSFFLFFISRVYVPKLSVAHYSQL